MTACLTGSDYIKGAIVLQKELHEQLAKGEFLLCKWNSNEPSVLESVAPELRDIV